MSSYAKASPMKYPAPSESDLALPLVSLADVDDTTSKNGSEGASSKRDLDGASTKKDSDGAYFGDVPGKGQELHNTLVNTGDSVDTCPSYPPPVIIAMGPMAGDNNANKSPSISDDRRCRICFEGEADREMGQLISPCLCKGSSRYIHLKCLQQWRELSHRSDSYYQCDTCRYYYSLSRPWAAKILDQKWLIHVITTIWVILLMYGLGWAGRALDDGGGWRWKDILRGDGGSSSTWTRVLGLDGPDYLFGVIAGAALGLLAWMLISAFAMVRSRGTTGSSIYAGCCTMSSSGCYGGCGWGAASGEGALVMVALVVVFGGVYLAFYGIYKVLSRLNQMALDKMKEVILEVN